MSEHAASPHHGTKQLRRSERRLPLLWVRRETATPSGAIAFQCLTPSGKLTVATGEREDQRVADRPRHNRAAVAILPRRDWLTRVVELPWAEPEDHAAMLRLEAEASVPAGFGSIETGHRLISRAGSTAVWEVSIARRAIVEAVVEGCRAFDQELEALVPSSLVWDRLLRRTGFGPQGQLLMAATWGPTLDHEGEAEVAFRGGDGSVVVRALRWTPGRAATAANLRTVAEALIAAQEAHEVLGEESSLLQNGETDANSTDAAGDARRTAWWKRAGKGVGAGSEANSGQGQGAPPPGVWLVESAEEALALLDGASRTSTRHILKAASAVGLGSADDLTAGSASLLPRGHHQGRQRRAMATQFAVGAASAVCGVALLWGALTVAANRWEAATAELLAVIETIDRDGEEVGEKLERLSAVAEARTSRDDFGSVLLGLHRVTPNQGISFNQVQRSPEGQLQVRGQADSLAMPFELILAMEADAAFRNVSLKDVGQTKKVGGTVVEFRLEAEHVRAPGRRDEAQPGVAAGASTRSSGAGA